MNKVTKNPEVLWNSNYTKIWIATFMMYFAFMLLAPLLPIYLSDNFGADKKVIGIVLSGYALFALITRSFSGYMVDRFPRKAFLMASTIVCVTFFAGYLVAGSLVLFAIVRTLHGSPYGASTVSLSTVAVDALPSSRRAEGIGYYGLSINIASAISPTVAIWIYNATDNFNVLFVLSMAIALAGSLILIPVRLKSREIIPEKKAFSLDRFFLVKGWSLALEMVLFSIAYGVVCTYVAIYGREELGIEGGSALFFLFLSSGLIISRLSGARNLKKGLITRNAVEGIIVECLGFILFALIKNEIGYYCAALIIGYGHGHMYPAYQNMFIDLAPNTQRGTANSSIMTSWDTGNGLGILFGGIIAGQFGYTAAFLCGAVCYIAGIAGFFLYSRGHFEKNKLR
ncbi:MAG: MFS transporter [Bacteroidales bacterium]|jgi:predicted MFS family arabinose efflux permease|nr:MFS transporter [Bacteroidales bacterium]